MVRDLETGEVLNDVTFLDGYLYIIQETEQPYFEGEEYHEAKYTLDVKLIQAEYDKPVKLSDIARDYPKVGKVLYEDYLRGAIYNYQNHSKGEWEKVGTTLGFA